MKKAIAWAVLLIVGVSGTLPASEPAGFDPKYTFKVTLKGTGDSFRSDTRLGAGMAMSF